MPFNSENYSSFANWFTKLNWNSREIIVVPIPTQRTIAKNEDREMQAGAPAAD